MTEVEIPNRQAAARAKALERVHIVPLQLDGQGSYVVPSATRPGYAHLVWSPLQVGELRSGWFCTCRAGVSKAPCWHVHRVAQMLGLEVE